MFLWHQQKADEETFLNDISVDIGVLNLTPNHPFPPQSADVAASDSFWSPPPRNSYRPQFGTASPITIPLIHSWYGTLVGIVSTFTFEQIVHNHKHVSSTYHLLETAVPMADVAMYTIKYIKRLTLTHVLFQAGWPTSSRQARVKELAELRLQLLVVVKTNNG